MSAARPDLFAVVSWGASGSQWLARLLNAHPDVLCLHHVRGQWARVMGQKPVDTLAYLRLVERQGRPYRLAGDVHGCDPHELPAARRQFGERLRIAALTRHPVPRILSQYAVLRERGFGFYGLSRRRLRRSAPPGLRAALDGDEQLFLVHVMALVNRIGVEQDLGPVFPMERLTGDVAEAQALLSHLSAGELTFPRDVLERLWADPVNAHAPASERAEPKATFESWPGWQRDAFVTLLEPDARARYEALGYDLGFAT